MEVKLPDFNPGIRVPGMDVLRIIACFMVMMVHSGEPFYIGDGGAIISENTFWVNTYGSLMRPCVPLFVMISGYFLLPSKDNMPVFYKKRFGRILMPFLFWSVMYLVIPFVLGEYGIGQMLINILKIGINFNDLSGHLWFVYMLIGLYLFIPVISPWIKNASRKELHLFLLIWAITLFIPYVKIFFPEILGEAYWNPNSSGYYFTGFLGYLVLGYYVKKEIKWTRVKRTGIAVALVIAGYMVTSIGFAIRMKTAPSIAALELTWTFTSFNVAMMTLGIFLLLEKMVITGEKIRNTLAKISSLTYGMYLAHLFFINFFHPLLTKAITNPMLVIPATAVLTFACSFLLIKTLSYLPKSKYIVG